MRGCCCLGVFRFKDSGSKKRSGMCLLWLTHNLTVSINPQPTPLNPTPQLYVQARRTNSIYLRLCTSAYLTVQTNILTRTHTGPNTTTNKLKRVKSCQAEHRVKIRHPCPPSQPKTSWSNLGRFQRER